MTLLQSKIVAPWLGDTTPKGLQDDAGIWFSTAAADVSIPPGPGKRKIAIRQDQTYETALIQEPSVWYFGGAWHMLYSSGSSVCYATSRAPDGPWSKSGPVLGNGVGGFAGAPQHGFLYEEEGTLYYFFVDSLTPTRFRVATASAATPTAWSTLDSGTWSFTPPAVYASSLGNIAVIRRSDGTYAWFVECSFGSNGWQIGVAVSSTLLGAAPVVTHFPITSLRPPQTTLSGIQFYPAGNPWVCEENGRYVMLYGISLTSTATEIYRAVSTDLVNWVPTDNGYPFIRRAAPEECDQAVDPHLARGPNGVYWAFWAAMNNVTLNSFIMCAPTVPAINVWDGDMWRHVDNSDPFFIQDFITWSRQTGDRTGINRHRVVYDTTSANRTHTVSRAVQGAEEEIINAGPSGGVNTVTLTPQSSDVILNNGAALVNGQAARLRCFVTGIWCRM